MSAISHEKQMRPTTEQTISKLRLIALEKQDGTFTVEVSIAFVLITLFYASKFGCVAENRWTRDGTISRTYDSKRFVV